MLIFAVETREFLSKRDFTGDCGALIGEETLPDNARLDKNIYILIILI